MMVRASFLDHRVALRCGAMLLLGALLLGAATLVAQAASDAASLVFVWRSFHAMRIGTETTPVGNPAAVGLLPSAR